MIRIIDKILPQQEKRGWCAPQMKIKPRDGRAIIVPSLPRSGTHVLIDLILNNFSAYKDSLPFYIRLHYCIGNSHYEKDMVSCGSYVVKTHLSEFNPSPEVNRWLQESTILRPVRDIEGLAKSNSLFFRKVAYDDHKKNLLAERAKSDSFWSKYNCHDIEFSKLVNIDCQREIVVNIANITGLELPKRIITSREKSDKYRVYLDKIGTRLLGVKSPVINTTIGFSLKK